MKDYIISDLGSLHQLIKRKRTQFSGSIKLNLQQLGYKKAIEYERKLNDKYMACGCETGAIFCSVTLLGISLFAIFSNQVLEWTFIKNALLILFAAGLVGKIVGIIIARIQFKSLVREIEQQIITNTL